MSDTMTGVPVMPANGTSTAHSTGHGAGHGTAMTTGVHTGMATLTVLRPHLAAAGEGATELTLRDDRLRRRELLLHHLELQRRRRARRSA